MSIQLDWSLQLAIQYYKSNSTVSIMSASSFKLFFAHKIIMDINS